MTVDRRREWVPRVRRETNKANYQSCFELPQDIKKVGQRLQKEVSHA
jgi:hypothetical protein